MKFTNKQYANLPTVVEVYDVKMFQEIADMLHLFSIDVSWEELETTDVYRAIFYDRFTRKEMEEMKLEWNNDSTTTD